MLTTITCTGVMVSNLSLCRVALTSLDRGLSRESHLDVDIVICFGFTCQNNNMRVEENGLPD